MFQKYHINAVHSSVPLMFTAMIVAYLMSKGYGGGQTVASNAITNDFIYRFLLPIIVLAEGFNMRKRSIGLYKTEMFVLSILIPVLVVAANSTILFYLQNWAFNKWHFDHDKFLGKEILISIAITMTQIELHGSVGPLHSIKNLRLFKILFGSALFNNNMSLIIVMTFERLIQSKSFGQDNVISNFLKVGCFSIGLGIGVGTFLS